jgi:hypothetical protein
MKPMASARKSSRSNGSSIRSGRKFVLCIRNEGYPSSLEIRKLYAVIADAAAEKHSLVRVVDESGEDYLYPAEFFVALRLPQSVKRAIATAC